MELLTGEQRVARAAALTSVTTNLDQQYTYQVRVIGNGLAQSGWLPLTAEELTRIAAFLAGGEELAPGSAVVE